MFLLKVFCFVLIVFFFKCFFDVLVVKIMFLDFLGGLEKVSVLGVFLGVLIGWLVFDVVFGDWVHYCSLLVKNWVVDDVSAGTTQ